MEIVAKSYLMAILDLPVKHKSKHMKSKSEKFYLKIKTVNENLEPIFNFELILDWAITFELGGHLGSG